MDEVTERASSAVDASAAHAVSLDGGNRLFASGGETGALLASIRWEDTPLGPVETWPQTLRTSVRICLSSRHAMIVWWGPNLVFFYNDAYAPTLGLKQPWAAGKPGREVWREIWDTIGPMLEGVLRTGEPTWSDDQLLFLERSGYLEESYHTYSYSPIEDDTGTVMGVFTAVTETTQRVLSERRARLARDLSAALVDARSSDDVRARTMRILSTTPQDVPFALLYGVDSQMQQATLLDAVGLATGTPLSSATVDFEETASHKAKKKAEGEAAADPWSLGAVARSGREKVVHNLTPDGMPCVERNYFGSGDPYDAVVLPLIEPGQSKPTMILVAGVNPRRSLDAEYHAFYTLLANHLSIALAAAHAYEAERKRAEALAEIDRAKTTFFSNVSHEFRTPLTLLLGPLEDSLGDTDELLAPRHRERLEVMQRNGLRLLKLVNTLLDFARIEAGRLQAAYEPTDLAIYTAELASSFRSLIEKAGMQLIVDCPPADGLAEPVYVDREMWEKVVLNLLSNAFKFTLEGSITVSVRPSADGRAVELQVRDTGVGIPADEVPFLFERFHRVEGMRARTHEGSGIGLALVQELVHLHGGTIRAESVEGEGTTFVIHLPVGVAHLPADRVMVDRPFVAPGSTVLGAATYVDEAARWLPDGLTADALSGSGTRSASTLESSARHHRPSPAAFAGPGGAHRPARIVLADDNADMRDYLARLLGEHYVVETVANGTQALDAIQRNPPDLVLSDVMMPELDGFGLLRTLRADPKTATLPVILLSARAGEEATAEGLEAGADDYLVKPFSAREILNRVAARLEISRIRAEAGRRTRDALEALLRLAEDLVRVPSAPSGRPQSLSELGSRLIVLFQRVFDCDMVSLCALDSATGSLEPMGILGLEPEVKAQWWDDVSHIPIQEYIAPDVLARIYTGQAVELDLDTEPLRNGANYDVHRILLAPMLLGETVTGLMAIEYRRVARPYSANDLALMMAIGRLCALVLERERLLRERESALAKMLALAETTRRMDEFLGIASHELRTPLTTITANVQMAGMQLGSLRRAVDMDLPEGQRSRLQRAELLLERTNRQVVRLDRLVGDLLDVSRIEAGKLEMRPEVCDLLDIVQDMVREQRTAWSRRSITFDLPSQTHIMLSADADRIGQVITNYLTNALKYSLDDRPVAVHVEIRDGMARVEVRDQGPGLTAEQQAHVFERFYRAPGIEQLSGSGVGLGLGLHICKTIIERHEGAVGLESVVGQGSTFWFTLPLANAAEGRG